MTGKKTIIKSIIVVLIVFLTSSCTEEKVEKEWEKITFNLQVEEHSTKVVSTFGPINLTALKNSSDGFAVCTNGLGSEMNNTVVTYVNAAWKYTDNFYWPISPTQNVSFTAYAPAGMSNATLTSSGLTVSGFTPDTVPENQIDLIYAAPNNFNRSTSGTNGVLLCFNHILTQVVFSVTTTLPASSNPQITDLTLRVPRDSGTFDGTNWIISGNHDIFTLFNNNNLSSTPITSTPLLMLPNTLSNNTNAKVTIISNGKSSKKTVDLSTLSNVTAWQMGYKVIYNITVINPTRNNGSDPDIRITAETSEGFI